MEFPKCNFSAGKSSYTFRNILPHYTFKVGLHSLKNMGLIMHVIFAIKAQRTSSDLAQKTDSFGPCPPSITARKSQRDRISLRKIKNRKSKCLYLWVWRELSLILKHILHNQDLELSLLPYSAIISHIAVTSVTIHNLLSYPSKTQTLFMTHSLFMSAWAWVVKRDSVTYRHSLFL